jgi:opacity protein-like surface antigen
VSRYLIFLIVTCTLSVFAFSQAATPASSPQIAHFPSAPTGEVYGGFQWENFDVHNFLGLPAGVTVPQKVFPGFHMSTSFALHRWAEVEGDISRDSQDYSSFFVTNDKLLIANTTILAGPRVRYRLGPLTQFAHVLLGVDHLTSKYTVPSIAPTSSSTDPFTFAIGGGTSFHISRSFGVETAADYIRVSSGTALNDIRVSVGPVFYFGGAKPVPAPYEPAAPVAPAPTRVIKTPPPPPQCIEYLIDARGNEWCLLHAGQPGQQ